MLEVAVLCNDSQSQCLVLGLWWESWQYLFMLSI